MNSLVPYLEVANEYIVMLKNENAELKAQADHRLELLREGLEATTMADGHWSDGIRWITWVGKVRKELEEENR